MSSTTSFFSSFFCLPETALIYFGLDEFRLEALALEKLQQKKAKVAAFCIHEILFQQNFESLETKVYTF